MTTYTSRDSPSRSASSSTAELLVLVCIQASRWWIGFQTAVYWPTNSACSTAYRNTQRLLKFLFCQIILSRRDLFSFSTACIIFVMLTWLTSLNWLLPIYHFCCSCMYICICIRGVLSNWTFCRRPTDLMKRRTERSSWKCLKACDMFTVRDHISKLYLCHLLTVTLAKNSESMSNKFCFSATRKSVSTWLSLTNEIWSAWISWDEYRYICKLMTQLGNCRPT